MENHNKKLIVIILPIFFLLCILVVFFIFGLKKNSASISVPVVNLSPTPAVNVPVVPTVAPDLVSIDKDLDSIKSDLDISSKEDSRLVPPDFLLNLGI